MTLTFNPCAFLLNDQQVSTVNPNTSSPNVAVNSNPQVSSNLVSLFQGNSNPKETMKKAFFGQYASEVQTGRTHDHGYNAIDYAPNHALIKKLVKENGVGVPVLNPGGTAVVESIKENEGGYGHSLVLRYADGTKLRIAHLEKGTVTNGQVKLPNGQVLKTGDSVAPGAQIGGYGMNSTGRTSGPHLHAEVIRSDGTKLSFDTKDAMNQIASTLNSSNQVAGVTNNKILTTV